MPKSSKPRKAYRPRFSIYPDLHDVGLIFRPIHVLFEHLREGEVDTAQGKPIFRDWKGQWCEMVPALEGWVGCWQRIARGEGINIDLSALTRLAKHLDYDIPLMPEQIEAAWKEVLVTQRLTLRIPRASMGRYMRDEQIQIEVDRMGLSHAA